MVDLNIQLPEGFLEEEVRCGYTVTSEMKKAWAVELDLLQEFINVCKKHNLHYCLSGGTLLGAVRHKGFIPWDNDIDVYMLREDYDRFLKLADEFEYPYFLQNSYTEKYAFRRHAKLRNSQTTGSTIYESYLKINKGIFIDIFPVDGIEEGTREARQQDRRNARYLFWLRKYDSAYSEKPLPNAGLRFKKRIKQLAFKFIDKEKLAAKWEDNLKRFSKPGTKLWGNRTMTYNASQTRRPYEEWTDLIECDFEMLKVMIPINYDTILRQIYGNYMEFPQDKKGGSKHGELILDPETPYDKKQW